MRSTSLFFLSILLGTQIYAITPEELRPNPDFFNPTQPHNVKSLTSPSSRVQYNREGKITSIEQKDKNGVTTSDTWKYQYFYEGNNLKKVDVTNCKENSCRLISSHDYFYEGRNNELSQKIMRNQIVGITNECYYEHLGDIVSRRCGYQNGEFNFKTKEGIYTGHDSRSYKSRWKSISLPVNYQTQDLDFMFEHILYNGGGVWTNEYSELADLLVEAHSDELGDTKTYSYSTKCDPIKEGKMHCQGIYIDNNVKTGDVVSDYATFKGELRLVKEVTSTSQGTNTLEISWDDYDSTAQALHLKPTLTYYITKADGVKRVLHENILHHQNGKLIGYTTSFFNFKSDTKVEYYN